MTVLVIDIGDTKYGQYSIPLIQRLCDYSKLNLVVLKDDINENYKQLHPSWLKLLCHDIIDDDFIVCWDLDLLPCNLYDIKPFFDLTKINLAFDTGNYFGKSYFNEKFKYNCGLIGIPKSESWFFKSIYHDFIPEMSPNYPSFEQYHVNDRLFDEEKLVNELPLEMNYLFNRYNLESSLSNPVLNVHYTSWHLQSESERIELIKTHHALF